MVLGEHCLFFQHRYVYFLEDKPFLDEDSSCRFAAGSLLGEVWINELFPLVVLYLLEGPGHGLELTLGGSIPHDEECLVEVELDVGDVEGRVDL